MVNNVFLNKQYRIVHCSTHVANIKKYRYLKLYTKYIKINKIYQLFITDS